MDAQCETQTNTAVGNNPSTNTVMQEQSQLSAYRQICGAMQTQAMQAQQASQVSLNTMSAICEAAWTLLSTFQAQALTLPDNVNGIYNGVSAVDLANEAVNAGSGNLFNAWAQFAATYQGYMQQLNQQSAAVASSGQIINNINKNFQNTMNQYTKFYNQAQSSLPHPQDFANEIVSNTSIAQAPAPNPMLAVANDLSMSANALITNTLVDYGECCPQISPVTLLLAVSNTASPTVPSLPAPTNIVPTQAPAVISTPIAQSVAPAVSIAAAAMPVVAPTPVAPATQLPASSSQPASVPLPFAVMGPVPLLPGAAPTPSIPIVSSGQTDINSISSSPLVANIQQNALYWGIGLIGLLWLLK